MKVILNHRYSNLASVAKMFSDYTVVSSVETLSLASRIVLPGVGTFGECMKEMAPFKEFLQDTKVPVLGICVGMQILCYMGMEDGHCPGLSITNGICVQLEKQHVGWDTIHCTGDHFLFDSQFDAYFMHGYSVKQCSDDIGKTENGITAIVAKDNFVGVQFHPEKSGVVGHKIKERFDR